MGDDVGWLEQLPDGFSGQSMDWEWESDVCTRSASPATSESSWTSLVFALAEDDEDDPQICLDDDSRSRRERRKPERQEPSRTLPRKLPSEERTAMEALVNEAVQAGRAHMSSWRARTRAAVPVAYSADKTGRYPQGWATDLDMARSTSLLTPRKTELVMRSAPAAEVSEKTSFVVFGSDRKTSILKLRKVRKGVSPSASPHSSPVRDASVMQAVHNHVQLRGMDGRHSPVHRDTSFWQSTPNLGIYLKQPTHHPMHYSRFPCATQPPLNNPFFDLSK